MSHQKEEKKLPPPVIPKDLLEYLERTFPSRTPALDQSIRQVWAEAGQQVLIAHLRSLFSRQNKPLE